MSTKDKVIENIRAGTAGIFIQSDDYARLDREIAEAAKTLGLTVREWNLGFGAINPDTCQPMDGDPGLLHFLQEVRQLEDGLFFIKNAKAALENEEKTRATLQQTLLHIQQYKQGKACIVYTSETHYVPDELSPLVCLLVHEPPTSEELTSVLAEFTKTRGCSIAPELSKKLVAVCVGMSESAFTQILLAAAARNPDFDEHVLVTAKNTKEQFVKKGGILKTVISNVSVEDLGGFNNLKLWLRNAKRAIDSEKAKNEYNVTAPKGILLVGMPGCGKSRAAEAVGSFFQVPLLQLDAGSLMGKYVGDSEGNLRKALTDAEAASPCVLWIDEIEKAFAGTNDDTGVMKRMLGHFLTWMQEKPKDVFLVATANDIESLPEELKRRGRFDEIFSVDFPNMAERADILRLHLSKVVNREESLNDRKVLTRLAKKTDGYTGADIANVVVDASRRAFVRNYSVNKALMKECMGSFTPSKKRFGSEQVKKYRAQFAKYTPVTGAPQKTKLGAKVNTMLNEISAGEMTYEAAMEYFIKHKNDSPNTVTGLMKKEVRDGVLYFSQYFCDADDNPVYDASTGKPCGRRLKVSRLDKELLAVFKDKDLVRVE